MHTASAKHADILPAATVILTRERAGALQAYLLKRSARSVFMAGYFVFPGGMVDSRDLQLEISGRHCDLTPEEIDSRFGPSLSAEQALAYGAAAIRETFLVTLPQGAVIVEPWDPMYHQDKIPIDPESLPAMILPVGESSSRLWCDHGIWKPVRL